ncbi:MAG TPA: hypothetical protein VFP43_21285, partial [Mesorhizobium sp.]|nr:hypothetical protein [Mesorhizobium sp.]
TGLYFPLGDLSRGRRLRPAPFFINRTHAATQGHRVAIGPFRPRLSSRVGKASDCCWWKAMAYVDGFVAAVPTAKKGMPYMVVTVSPEGVTATAVESKDEARILASKKTLKVLVEDDSENSDPVKSSPSP